MNLASIFQVECQVSIYARTDCLMNENRSQDQISLPIPKIFLKKNKKLESNAKFSIPNFDSNLKSKFVMIVQDYLGLGMEEILALAQCSNRA